MAAAAPPGGAAALPAAPAVPAAAGGGRANIHQNLHNATKDLPVYKDTQEERDDPTQVIGDMEVWLDDRECQYVMDRNDGTRAAHVANENFQLGRVQADQRIFWALLRRLFGKISRFGTAMRSKNETQLFYATEVWKLACLLLNPADQSQQHSLIQRLAELLPMFEGNFEPWASAIHKIHFDLTQMRANQNDLVLCEQLQAMMTLWCTANKINLMSRAARWDIFLTMEINRLVPAPQVLMVDLFVQHGTEYERHIFGGPEYSSMADCPKASGAGGTPATSATPGAAPGANVPPGFAYMYQGLPTQANKQACQHCCLTNHESPDCKTLPQNAQMWCERCKSDTHWGTKCRFQLAADRNTEKQKAEHAAKGG
eukprot:3183138-Rhodomonas_salina.1